MRPQRSCIYVKGAFCNLAYGVCCMGFHQRINSFHNL